jgi:predicted NAD/FAD-binding protein
MSRYCVIGSGISGATIANLLSKKHSVDLFDKARGPGGRSSFKRLDKKKVLIMELNIYHLKV